jgi:hypothetical protein
MKKSAIWALYSIYADSQVSTVLHKKLVVKHKLMEFVMAVLISYEFSSIQLTGEGKTFRRINESTVTLDLTSRHAGGFSSLCL